MPTRFTRILRGHWCRRHIALTGAAAMAWAAACAGSAPASARFTREIPWYGQGVWLKADTHVHTNFSDGKATVDEVVTKAASFGCDVVAITDHADINLQAATPEYFQAIDTARLAHPGLTILAGVEWNVPPWGGDQHATVLVPPAAERALAEFKTRFDDHHRSVHEYDLAVEALRWLEKNASAGDVQPVITWEHPSRAEPPDEGRVAVLQAWRNVNDLAVGFAGAPGHQGASRVGDYKSKNRPIDRWDPAVARVDDAWDALLARGTDVWAANAPSDFHSDGGRLKDYWPCEFAATWLYAPDRSAEGALRALKAGSVFAEHGRSVRDVRLEVAADGLARAAGSGEAIEVPEGTHVTTTLRFEAAQDSWPDRAPAQIAHVELIAIDATGARVVAQGPPATPVALTHSMRVPAAGVVVRGRGYRQMPTGERLAFYTNPVRIAAVN